MANTPSDTRNILEAFISLLREDQMSRFVALGKGVNPEAINFRPGPRPGLAMAELDRNQRSVVRRLLSCVLSQPGFERLSAIMSMEDAISRHSRWLKDQQREDYWVAFGEKSRRMFFRFEGHHISLSITLGPGNDISVLPYCLGAYPAKRISQQITTWHPLGAREMLAREIALCEPSCVSNEVPGDILRDGSGYVRPDLGISVTAMRDQARRLIDRLIEGYLEDFADELRARLLSRIESTQLRFRWAGSTDLRTDHYYSLTDSDLSIEYINQCHDEDLPNHQHTVFRSRRLDFGRDLLGG